MADTEHQEEVKEEVKTEDVSQEPSKKEYTDVEQKAMEQGWVPEEEYQGSGKWRSAEDFLDRGDFFAKIDEQKRQLKSLDAALTETKKHLIKVRETEFKRALATLRNEKKEAIEAGDGGRVVEIDEEIANAQSTAAQEIRALQQPAQMPAAQDPVFAVWQNRNPWYTQDRAMKIYADTIAEELVLKGLNNPAELLRETERRVKKEFAHKFNNENRGKPGSVEGGGSKGSGTGKETFQLTPEETQVMNKFIKHGVLTREQYIADIKASRKG